MSTYFYQATDDTGKIVEGDIEASDYQIALQKVRGLNYYPIRVSEDKPQEPVFSEWRSSVSRAFSTSPLSSRELLEFTQQMSTLISSKLTLDRSLTITTRLAEKEKNRVLLEDIQKRVHAGSSFADALAVYPNSFSKMYINMVRAGELGGVLDAVLKRLASFLENLQDTKSKVTNAMIYPAILFFFGGLAILFLMMFVVPKFSSIFGDKTAAIPFVTQILLQISGFLTQNVLTIAATSAMAMVALITYLKSPTGKLHMDRLILKLPLFGSLIKKVEVSRFSRTMATLMSSGIPVLQALNVVQSVVQNRVIGEAMGPLKQGLKSGQGLSRSLQKSDLFPSLAVHMIVVGEETGELEEMMVKVADTFDKEVDNSIRRTLALLGPLLLLSIGGTLIFIVFAIFLGMFSVTDLIM